MFSRREFVHLVGAGGLLALAKPGNAVAQSVRTGTTKLLVGFPAGGSIDVIARLLVSQLRGYASTMIVENRPGAGGQLSLATLKSSAPDGSTLVLTPAGMLAIFPHTYKTLPYDPFQDFTPVSTVATFPFLLTVGPKVPTAVKSIPDFVAWCRANTKDATYGTPGLGSLPHFLGVEFARASKTELVHVPYKGSQSALQDMVKGDVAANFGLLGNAAPLLASGQIRALAITAPSRTAGLPAIPTFREAGYPDLEAVEWFGVFVPAGTPAATVDQLNAEIRKALTTKVVRDGLATWHMDPAGNSPAEFARLVRSDFDRWGAVVRAAAFAPLE